MTEDLRFQRRAVPIEMCACPTGEVWDLCTQSADGEDRLCAECRENHDPDKVGQKKGR